MDSLRTTVREVMAGYARKGINVTTFLTQNDDWTVFSVVSVARIDKKRVPGVSLIVHIIGNLIIIDRDQNDKILLDALLQAGIPREQIILAYAGEPVPETETA
jgi:hypothetical protein